GEGREREGREREGREQEGREREGREREGREGEGREGEGREREGREREGREQEGREGEGPAGEPVRASPVARRRARELGVDLSGLAVAHPGRALSLADVERAAETRAGETRAGETPETATSPDDRAAAMRRSIATAMARSKREIPHYYLGTDIIVERATAWLSARNAERPVDRRVLFAALLFKAVALALREVPELNGTYVDGTFRPGAGIHPGIAVALRGGGLIAPALHDADRLPLDDGMRALADLLERARRGQLRGAEIVDPTITITNLGDLGVDTVYGVITPPQVAIVGLGRVATKPWVIEGQVVPARVLHTTLSADHRVSDGMRGSRFLATLDQLLQAPEALE
ncbi:MAG: dihydrolipoamide acetyltransferase family protein, partial [Gemmatimonas sp.]|uniref:dihydrolipoamide acetyltransferase family protein n=1 Tax=Gemmatimonas sp. TaxID=1962908 RepID=UPI00391F063B